MILAKLIFKVVVDDLLHPAYFYIRTQDQKV
jgi:hypothetical protein